MKYDDIDSFVDCLFSGAELEPQPERHAQQSAPLPAHDDRVARYPWEDRADEDAYLGRAGEGVQPTIRPDVIRTGHVETGSNAGFYVAAVLVFLVVLGAMALVYN